MVTGARDLLDQELEESLQLRRVASHRRCQCDRIDVGGLQRAHLDLATSRFLYRYDWKGAEAEYRTTLRLAPGNADARFSYAVFLAARGRRDEALREAEKARWQAPSATEAHPQARESSMRL